MLNVPSSFVISIALRAIQLSGQAELELLVMPLVFDYIHI
jgi:hypothetical protein